MYVGSEDTNLYALTADGKLGWKFATGGPIMSSPVVGRDGTVYFGSDDMKLYAVKHSCGPPPPAPSPTPAPPLPPTPPTPPASSSCPWLTNHSGAAFLNLINFEHPTGEENAASYHMDIRIGTTSQPSTTATVFHRLRLNNFVAGQVDRPPEILLTDFTFATTTFTGQCAEPSPTPRPKCAPAAFATSLSCSSPADTTVVDLRGTPFAVARGAAQWTSCGVANEIENNTCAFGSSAIVNCTDNGQRCELKCGGNCETCAPKQSMHCGSADDPACNSDGYPIDPGAVLQLVIYNESLLYAAGCPQRPSPPPTPPSPSPPTPLPVSAGHKLHWVVLAVVCVVVMLGLVCVVVMHRRRKRLSFSGHGSTLPAPVADDGQHQPLLGGQPPIPAGPQVRNRIARQLVHYMRRNGANFSGRVCAQPGGLQFNWGDEGTWQARPPITKPPQKVTSRSCTLGSLIR